MRSELVKGADVQKTHICETATDQQGFICQGLNATTTKGGGGDDNLRILLPHTSTSSTAGRFSPPTPNMPLSVFSPQGALCTPGFPGDPCGNLPASFLPHDAHCGQGLSQAPATSEGHRHGGLCFFPFGFFFKPTTIPFHLGRGRGKLV